MPVLTTEDVKYTRMEEEVHMLNKKETREEKKKERKSTLTKSFI